MILLCIISYSDPNGSVDCTGDGDDSFIEFDMCSYLSCKIRFKAPKRQRGTEGDDKDTVKLIYNNIDFSRYDY